MRVDSSFGVRPEKRKKRNIKYFLVFEGAKTESAYFEGIKKYRNKIGIHALIEIHSVKRETPDKNTSNPYIILTDLCKDIKCDIEKSHNYEDTDKICFIFDRDSESFTSEQWDSVLEICNKEQFDLYITNPYFELWLLLHCDLQDIAIEHIIQNEKVSNNKNYIEHILSQKIDHFNKSKLRFEQFVDGIKNTAENSKLFETDLAKLKDTTGCNLTKLFEEWGIY